MRPNFIKVLMIAMAVWLVGAPAWAGLLGGNDADIPPDVVQKLNIAYGPHAKQRLDVYIPPQVAQGQVRDAPILLMVHGGGWRHGTKSRGGVVGDKAVYWLGQNFIFVSTDYRLLPDAPPDQQAEDVAAAFKYVSANAAKWGGSAGKIILMGHSAGAHLVAYVGARVDMLKVAGALALPLGVVALDSAAYDITSVMENRHFGLYDDAFGKNPDYWRLMSPITHLSAQSLPIHMVCSSRRAEACLQAEMHQKVANSLGVRAEINPQNLSHAEINRDLGQVDPQTIGYTRSVDAFIQSLLR